MEKGIFVTFEGSEGCGKTTQIQLLADWLIANNYETVLTREPGGTELGEQIRNVILSTKNTSKICDIAELLLFEAARAQHVEQKILPAINEGKIVLCDRFIDSSTVYQGIARGISEEKLNILNDIAINGCTPDMTIVFDVPANIGSNRVDKRGIKKDRIENENQEFFEKVRKGYLNIASSDNRFFVIDGTDSISNISEKIKNEFISRFK